MKTECVVIGGGAAGMMAAITAAKAGSQVILIEHTDRLGKKLLQTGNGRCNFTNLELSPMAYPEEARAFVGAVEKQFGLKETLAFFEQIGIFHKDRNGYVYPCSDSAAALQDALRLEVAASGVQIFSAVRIDTICREAGEFLLKGMHLSETEQPLQLHAHAVILATGSCAAPQTGSDGSGYELARQLGHSVRKVLPALVQLVSDDRLCKNMAGVRCQGIVSLFVQGKWTVAEQGELQFTDYGISGIPVFQLSRYAVQALDRGEHVQVSLDLLPDFKQKELWKRCSLLLETCANRTVEQLFSGLMPRKLVQAVAKRAGISPALPVRSMTEQQLQQLISTGKNFTLQLTGFRSFAQAQVCQGGVCLQEIRPNMESALVPGLFFAGEITDVDGRCGGYNLQWAWSSGYVAGTGAASRAKRGEKFA